MTFPVVTDLAGDGVPVKLSCRVLGFSRQAYYQWLADPVSERERSDAQAANAVLDAHADDPEFGYRFLAEELRDKGLEVSDHQVLKACRLVRVRCCHSIRRGAGKRPGPPVHDDLVRREFTADRPNHLWLTDISEHWTGDSKLYLCAVKDVFSNRIVGYSIDRRMTSQLAVDALQMAVARRGGRSNVAGCRVHSDRGSQFRSRRYVETIRVNGLVGSMGRVGAAGDNAAMESFFALLQKNVLNRRRWTSFEQLRLAIVTWIERTYHRRRRQARLGRLTPIEFEMVQSTQAAAAA
ncbi:putative transposase [Gordonia sputi NBRC 100414]|uniref:Putative transposase n=2 Tax=Gordonia sputi TaxID=36823 RepID=H5TVP3_9ACTN|nr:putative transposase [Gordonia sputi NBRC 100414]